jgi:hypothetical protein
MYKIHMDYLTKVIQIPVRNADEISERDFALCEGIGSSVGVIKDLEQANSEVIVFLQDPAEVRKIRQVRSDLMASRAVLRRFCFHADADYRSTALVQTQIEKSLQVVNDLKALLHQHE